MYVLCYKHFSCFLFSVLTYYVFANFIFILAWQFSKCKSTYFLFNCKIWCDKLNKIVYLLSFHFLLANLIHSLRISTLAIFMTAK